jgi:hypothetical protein
MQSVKSRISPEDYAAPMVDEVERPAHIRQRFEAGYCDGDRRCLEVLITL